MMTIREIIMGGILGKTLTYKQRKTGLALFLAYMAALQFSIEMYTTPAVLSFAPGIALAGLILGGIVLWPIIFFASAVIYIFNGYGLFFVIALSLAHTLQATVGAYILDRLKFEPTLNRLQDMLSLMSAAFGASVIAPTIAYGAFYLNRYLFEGRLPQVSWGSWWMGVAMSILIVTPFIVSWFSDNRRVFESHHKLIEAVIALGAVIGITFASSWLSISHVGEINIVFFLLAFLMWIALRLGVRSTTLALLIVTIIGFTGIFLGNEVPSPENLGAALFGTGLLLEITAAIFLIIVGIDEERKINMRQLIFHVEQLEEAIGMRDEFISIASHELKTPVTTLKIYSQMMQREFKHENESPLFLKYASKMNAQLDKLVSLVEDLLNVSRLRLGKLEFNYEKFDLNALVKEMVEDVQPNSDTHTLKVAGMIHNSIWGDKDRIAQVIVNLINNAIKYSPQANVVEITLSSLHGYARVAVRDFGIGIDPKHHDKIFGLFYRIADEGENTFPGFGIGLHISREIIERHGGKISVESVPGEGSEFSFTIPYAPKETFEISAEETEESTAYTKKLFESESDRDIQGSSATPLP